MMTETITKVRIKPQLRPLFLVWGFPQGSHRSQLMAQELGMQVQHVYFIAKQGKWQALLKYPVQAVQTLVVLARQRPRAVFIQNPPIFSSLVVYLYSLLTGSRFVIDSNRRWLNPVPTPPANRSTSPSQRPTSSDPKVPVRLPSPFEKPPITTSTRRRFLTLRQFGERFPGT